MGGAVSQQIIGVGTTANDKTGDPARTWAQKDNANFTELYSAYSKAVFAGSAAFVGTTEQRITAAVASAVALGLSYVIIPQTMLPFNVALVTLNNAVQLFREGGILDGSLFDVQAYGAAGNDTQDDTASFQAAADAAKANTATLYIAGDRAGANQAVYKLLGVVNITGNNRRVIQDFGGIIKCYNTTGPCLWFRGSAAGGVGQQFTQVFGLAVQAAAGGYKQPLVQFGDPSGFSWFSIENVKLDNNPGSFQRDGFWLHSAFNGSFKDTFVSGFSGGRAWNWRNDPALNGGNVNFINCVADNPIAPMFCIQEYYGLANNLINSIHFDNCKSGGNIGPTNKFFAGTVNANQAINSTTITLSAGQGANYAATDWIIVVHGTTFWTDRVASVAGDVLTLTDPNGTPFALSTNDPVVVGIWHSALGPNVRTVRYDTPHWERTNGVIAVATANVFVDRPYCGSTVFRGLYLVNGCQGFTLQHPNSTSDLQAGGALLHQGNDVNNARNAVIGPLHMSGPSGGTAQKVIQKDGGASCVYVNRQSIAAVVGSYSMTQNDSEINIDASGGASTITLLSAVNVPGMRVRVKKTDGSVNLVTITATAGNIDGQTNAYLIGQNQQIEFESDGANWFIQSGNRVPRVLFRSGELSTASAVDVSIASVSLPPSALVAIGDTVRITVRGISSGGAGVPNIKFGATTILTGTVTAGNAYEMSATVSRSTATTQRAVALLDNGTAIGVNTRSSPAETLANAILIDIRGSIPAGTLTVDHVLIECVTP